MLSSISWSNYFAATSILVIFYYVAIGYKYYKQDILALIGNNNQSPKTLSFATENLQLKPVIANHKNYQPLATDTVENLPNLVQSFTDETTAYLQQAGNDQTDKVTILLTLQRIILKYPALIKSDFKQSLEAFISNEVESNSTIQLSEDEVGRLWQL